MDFPGLEIFKVIDERFGRPAGTALLFLICIAVAVTSVSVIFTFFVVPVTDFFVVAFEPSLTRREAAEFGGRLVVYVIALALLLLVGLAAFSRVTGIMTRRIDRNLKVAQAKLAEIQDLEQRAQILTIQAEAGVNQARRIMAKMKSAVFAANTLDELKEVFGDYDPNLSSANTQKAESDGETADTDYRGE